jgi:hypothetical protein
VDSENTGYRQAGRDTLERMAGQRRDVVRHDDPTLGGRPLQYRSIVRTR